jgi:glycosyltransferase involved in cell wall biosynthesis
MKNEYIKKIKHIYNNQGVKILVVKGSRFIKTKVNEIVTIRVVRVTGKYIKKIKHIYNNQGVKILVVKGSRFIKTKVNEMLSEKKYKPLWEEYNYLSNPLFQITEIDINNSKAASSGVLPSKIKTANWFVPNFDHIKFGGIFTIFRFIEKLSSEGINNRIIIYDNPSFDVSKLDNEIQENFPNLKNYKIIVYDMKYEDVNNLPSSDLSFCSFWTSAYLLLKFNKTKRKYYFIQDYEPLFYPGGSIYALAESTYRFGFRGLVNTPGLLAAVNSRHGMEGISFIPAVDQTIYHSPKERNNKKVRIFFYARPNNPRNAFNLGIIIIKKLLKRYGHKIEIITAGAEWDESAFGLSGKITNLGLLGSLEEVSELYSNCDIGFVYMLSKHPSYQPFEFMASGMATVTNNNEDNLWLLSNGKNCLLAEPSPADMVEKISQLIDDKAKRLKIAKNGVDFIKGYTWDQQLNTIWNDIKQN